jgi:hypothetical protein
MLSDTFDEFKALALAEGFDEVLELGTSRPATTLRWGAR